MRISWVPQEPGNWIFHCHLMRHMSFLQTAPLTGSPAAHGSHGVPGWSGMPGRVSPAVLPGDSFAVRMTPPRAGTFMYHVHREPGHQLAQGLYGPFLVIVLRVGETYDFRWMPERPEEYVLRITTTFDRGLLAFPRDAPPPHMAEIPVRVR